MSWSFLLIFFLVSMMLILMVLSNTGFKVLLGGLKPGVIYPNAWNW